MYKHWMKICILFLFYSPAMLIYNTPNIYKYITCKIQQTNYNVTRIAMAGQMILDEIKASHKHRLDFDLSFYWFKSVKDFIAF